MAEKQEIIENWLFVVELPDNDFFSNPTLHAK